MQVVFLDRDGTINDDQTGYIKDKENFHLFPYTGEAIRILNNLGYKIIVVTNQSGIARGYYSVEQLEKVHDYMVTELSKEKATVDLILYSPFYEEGIVSPYNIAHDSRKPGSGMFFKALSIFPFQSSQSFMVGDKPEDISFGKKNGLQTILVRSGYGSRTWANHGELEDLPDFVCDNLLSASYLIQHHNKWKNKHHL